MIHGSNRVALVEPRVLEPVDRQDVAKIPQETLTKPETVPAMSQDVAGIFVLTIRT